MLGAVGVDFGVAWVDETTESLDALPDVGVGAASAGVGFE